MLGKLRDLVKHVRDLYYISDFPMYTHHLSFTYEQHILVSHSHLASPLSDVTHQFRITREGVVNCRSRSNTLLPHKAPHPTCPDIGQHTTNISDHWSLRLESLDSNIAAILSLICTFLGFPQPRRVRSRSPISSRHQASSSHWS